MKKKCPNCGACPECGARQPYVVQPHSPFPYGPHPYPGTNPRRFYYGYPPNQSGMSGGGFQSGSGHVQTHNAAGMH